MATTSIRQIVHGQRQLFLDDADVAQIDNLRRALHPAEKKGAVIRPNLLAPESYGPQIRCGPAWNPQRRVFQLWACAVTPEGTEGKFSFSGYCESADGIHWTLPNVNQIEVNGTRANHFVYLRLDGGYTVGLDCVVCDPHDADPSRRYKGLAYIRDTNELLPAASPDGIVWRRLDGPALPTQDEFNLSYDDAARQFIATLKVKGPYGRSHALTTSADFVDWTTPELVFHADAEDQIRARDVIEQHLANPLLRRPVSIESAEYGADVYNFAVFRYEGMYIGMPAMFYHAGRAWQGRNHDGFHHVQLTCSRDLHHWQRLGDRQPFIAPSPLGGGAYDTMQIMPPSFPIVQGDMLWFYYSGLKYRWLPDTADGDRAAVCLATLRRDGFISLDADADGGTVTTQPFTHDGTRLYLNADTGKGHVACELLDAAGNAIPGYGRQDCQPISSDSTRLVVHWQGQERLPAGPIRLRLHLKQARLYSYWIE